MKLVFLSALSVIGGAERVLLELIGGLRQIRPEWELGLIVPGIGSLSEVAGASGVATTVLPLPSSFAALGDSKIDQSGGRQWRTLGQLGIASPSIAAYGRKLSAVLSALKPDVIHSNGFKTHLLSVWSAPPSTPLLWHMHDYLSARPLMRTGLRFCVRYCSAMVANSASVASDIGRYLKGAAPIHIVHNGIDVQRFSPSGPRLDLDQRAGADGESGLFRVGLIATSARWKGHEIFMRALGCIPREKRVRGYIIGAPIYATRGSQFSLDELRQMAAGLGVADRIAFTGYIDDIPAAIRSLDLVVHTSIAPEPFGMVIAEAMACGRPVITSGYGGAAELIEPGRDALTFHTGDARDLADKITMLADNSSLRDDLGRAARLAVQQKFDRARMTRRFVEIYTGLTGYSQSINASAACP